MAGNILLSISIVFLALAVVFVAVAVQDILSKNESMKLSGSIRLKMAFIFSAVAAGLSFLNLFLR